RGMALADFNEDGRVDIITANNNSTATLLTGDAVVPLVEDPAGSGVRSGYARGNVWSGSDSDYFRFSANAGDVLTLTVDNLVRASGSTLRYQIFDAGGTQIISFNSNFSNGTGQSNPVTLAGGTYYLVVTDN